MKKFSLKLWCFVFFILIIDQSLKLLIKINLDLGERIIITRWFHILFVENNGFAFGLEFFGGSGKLLLTCFRVVFVCLIFNWIVRFIAVNANRWCVFALLLIFSGAIGNIIDSVFYGVFFDYAPLGFGRVVDMFYFPIFSGTYPDWLPFFGGNSFVFFRFIFNIADSCITVGALLLIVLHKKVPLKY